MRSFLGLLISFFLTLPAFATEQRQFQKVDANTAVVKIITEERDSTQVANYIDAQENAQYLLMLLADHQSKLSLLMKQIQQDNCGTTTEAPDGWIDGCGGAEITDFVRTSFGRGGWMEAGAGYTFFVGFRSAGTGRFFESTYMVTFFEHGVADVDQNGEYLGSITKDLTFGTVTKLPSAQPQ